MEQWQTDAIASMERLRTLLRESSSNILPYVLERLSVNLEGIPKPNVDKYTIESFVRGACRVIGDSGYNEDSDPIIVELLNLNDLVTDNR